MGFGTLASGSDLSKGEIMEAFTSVTLGIVSIILLVQTVLIGTMRKTLSDLKLAISDFNKKTAAETVILQEISERTERTKEVCYLNQKDLQTLVVQHADKDPEEMIEAWKIGPLMRKRMKETHEFVTKIMKYVDRHMEDIRNRRSSR